MISPDITGNNRQKRSGRGRFKPGTTGNPNGRPKGTLSITATIKAKLEEIYPNKNKEIQKTYLNMIVEVILDNAIEKRDPHMLKEIWAYVDGKPKASLDLHTDAERTELKELTTFFKKIGSSKTS